MYCYAAVTKHPHFLKYIKKTNESEVIISEEFLPFLLCK